MFNPRLISWLHKSFSHLPTGKVPESSKISLTPKLFTKFFRSQDTLKKETSGSGLGLYISKNIIRRHGGEIWANSIEKRGSTFYFVLPTDEKLIPPVEIIEEEF